MEEKEILGRCREGDMEGYRMLYEKYGQYMYNTARRMMGNRYDAEDAVQTAFVRLVNGLKQFRSRSMLSTYLYRIVTNVCLDALKKRNRERPVELNSHLRTSRTDHDTRIALENAIALLPDMQRACFVLFAVEGLKQSDISRILGLSVGGVKSNVFHAKKRLREILAST